MHRAGTHTTVCLNWRRIYYYGVCVCITSIGTHATLLVWRSENNSVESVLSFTGFWDWIQVGRFARQAPLPAEASHQPHTIFSCVPPIVSTNSCTILKISWSFLLLIFFIVDISKVKRSVSNVRVHFVFTLEIKQWIFLGLSSLRVQLIKQVFLAGPGAWNPSTQEAGAGDWKVQAT